MTNQEMARGHLMTAKRILEEAERHAEARTWNLVIRRSQEVVELALKGALRWVGLEIPEVHDVGGFLKRYQDRLKGRLRDEADRIASISRRLRKERETSFYGDEETELSPEELYSREDAEGALREARFVLEICEEFVEGSRR